MDGTLALRCLVASPLLGLLAATAAENPPGRGPGVLQVVLVVAVTTALSLFFARRAGRAWSSAWGWAAASLAAVPILFVFVLLVIVGITPL